MARPARCPTCDRPIEWSEAFPFRPFCSERCRLIDLGAWFSGERAIAGDPAGDPDEGRGQERDDQVK
ncbi:MAG TPA: DNA gyrase inhibitor YacG [Steroidobacteraceae bacterium]|nr:DNA gyrase inhibitor YacG [Steroidobacteraceae bacterium]